MVQILHLSDIHLGSGFAHGQINPETGLNSRFEDFVSALGRCIDAALERGADLVLFGGDAFPDATPAPYIQQAFSRQFQRLVQAQIPVVMLVGNHDQHAQGEGGASLSIYRTLSVPGVTVGDRLETHRIATPAGPVQVVTLPWLTRSTLMTRPETEGLSLSEVSERLLACLRLALEGEIRQLDPALPTVLLGHALVDSALVGAERFLAVGKGFTLPLSLLARDCFDYVALGHVHRHQVLCHRPPVVYPGSIERVDFSEETEDKGFVWLELTRGQAQFEFCPLAVRPFRTIKLDISQAEEPQTRLLAAIAEVEIAGAIVRLIYRLAPAQLDAIDDQALHQALAPAHSYSIQPELVSQLRRSRLPELNLEQQYSPLEALQTYLEHRQALAPLAPDLLAAAQALLQGDRWHPQALPAGFSETGAAWQETEPEPASQTQLRLL